MTPLLGTAVLATFTVTTPNWGKWSAVIVGLIAALIAVLYPRGLGGVARRSLRYRFGRRTTVRGGGTPPKPAGALGHTGDTEPLSLRVEGVRKVYGGVVALDDVSFEVKGPGCLGVIGANGSGKSTLIGVLSGIIKPTAGRVRVHRGEGAHLLDVRVARCFQQPKLVDNLRVWENIAVGGRDRASRQPAVAREFGALVGLADAELDAWPTDISTGNKRKVELARALLSDPHVLLLDEPAAGLSSEELADFVDVLRRAIVSRLVIIVEHNLGVVYALADEVVLLAGGRLVERDTPEQMRESPVVAEAYLGVVADDDDADGGGDAAPGGRRSRPADVGPTAVRSRQ